MAGFIKEVPTRKLNDGYEIPILSFGTGTALSKRENKDKLDKERVKSIKTAIDVGYLHLDCAEGYSTELELGHAIKESKLAREKFFITTKVETGLDDIPSALDNSLKALGLDYVDLYLIHSPLGAFFSAATTQEEKDKKLQSAWAAMESVQAAGKARSIGVSNYTIPHLETTLKTAKVVPAVNQIEFHPYLQHGKLLDYHQEKGILTEAYGGLAPITQAKGGPVDDLLPGLGKKYGVNDGEILLRYIIDKEGVPITTSSKEQRLSDYLRVLTFNLTPREVEEIDKAGAQKHFRGYWGAKHAADDRD